MARRIAATALVLGLILGFGVRPSAAQDEELLPSI
jgi:hypothetical protein